MLVVNSFNITRAFWQKQFQRIFEITDNRCKSLIARAQFLYTKVSICYMTEKITNARALNCSAIQIKYERKVGLLSTNHNNEVIFADM